MMTENELFVLGKPETQPHDILWDVRDGKTMVEARARKISGCSQLRWVVGVGVKTGGSRVGGPELCV